MCQTIEIRGPEEPKPFTTIEQKAIDDLKLLCNQQAKIRIQMDNYFLTKFLRYTDWNAEMAYKAILNFYELKVRFQIQTIYQIF